MRRALQTRRARRKRERGRRSCGHAATLVREYALGDAVELGAGSIRGRRVVGQESKGRRVIAGARHCWNGRRRRCRRRALVVAPAIGAPRRPIAARAARDAAAAPGIGSFTPAAADPRLAAVFARGGLGASGFRFTPCRDARSGNRAVTVAVRARSTNALASRTPDAIAIAAPPVGLAPIAYNLGVAVGWKRFAVSGDVAKRRSCRPAGQPRGRRRRRQLYRPGVQRPGEGGGGSSAAGRAQAGRRRAELFARRRRLLFADAQPRCDRRRPLQVRARAPGAARPTIAATARRSMSGPRSASDAARADRRSQPARRSPPSHRTPRCRDASRSAARVHPAQRDHRHRRQPARSIAAAAPGPARARRDATASAKTGDTNTRSRACAPRRDRLAPIMRRPRSTARATAARCASRRARHRPAAATTSISRRARARSAAPCANSAPPLAPAASHDAETPRPPRAAAAAARATARRPSARRSSARRGTGWRRRIAPPIARAHDRPTPPRSPRSTPASPRAAALARARARRRDADRGLQDARRRRDRAAARRRPARVRREPRAGGAGEMAGAARRAIPTRGCT